MEKNFKFVTINFAKLNNFCGEIYKEIENNNFIDLINKDITKIKDEEKSKTTINWKLYKFFVLGKVVR